MNKLVGIAMKQIIAIVMSVKENESRPIMVVRLVIMMGRPECFRV